MSDHSLPLLTPWTQYFAKGAQIIASRKMNCVPGVNGKNQPRGTKTSSTSEIVIPAALVSTPLEEHSGAAYSVAWIDCLSRGPSLGRSLVSLGEHAETGEVFESMSDVDVALIAHGTLPDQKACEQDFDITLREFDANATGSLSLSTHLANRFERQGHGTIAVITSVAGDRGRQSNYVYGASKAMISVFLQGLRNRLHGSHIAVVDIRPGFVDTPMNDAFDKSALWAKPDQVAGGIVNAIDQGRSVAYLPWFWRYIKWVIRLIPEAVFKRLRL